MGNRAAGRGAIRCVPLGSGRNLARAVPALTRAGRSSATLVLAATHPWPRRPSRAPGTSASGRARPRRSPRRPARRAASRRGTRRRSGTSRAGSAAPASHAAPSCVTSPVTGAQSARVSPSKEHPPFGRIFRSSKWFRSHPPLWSGRCGPQ